MLTIFFVIRSTITGLVDFIINEITPDTNTVGEGLFLESKHGPLDFSEGFGVTGEINISETKRDDLVVDVDAFFDVPGAFSR